MRLDEFLGLSMGSSILLCLVQGCSWDPLTNLETRMHSSPAHAFTGFICMSRYGRAVLSVS